MKCSDCKFLKYQKKPYVNYNMHTCTLKLPPQYEQNGQRRIISPTFEGCDLGQRDEGIPEFEKVFENYDIPDYVK